MQEIIKIEEINGDQVVSSLTVATELGVEHRATVQVIEKYLSEIEATFGLVTFKMLPDSLGRMNTPQKVAYLTEDQAIFVSTLSRNSQQVVQFKARLVQAFQAARKFIKEVTAPLSKEALWLEALNSLHREVEIQKQQFELARATVQKQAPMVAYYNDVLAAENSHIASHMAQMFGLHANTFNKKLMEWGILDRVGGEYKLKGKYMATHRDCIDIRVVPIPSTTGKQMTKNELRWTEKARPFLIEEFGKRGYSIKALA